MTFLLATADPASQLMQLSQAETLGIADQHDAGIGNIDAYFYYCRRDENIDISLLERPHYLSFFRWLHFTMQ